MADIELEIPQYIEEMLRTGRREKYLNYLTGSLGTLILIIFAIVLFPFIPFIPSDVPIRIKDVEILSSTENVCPGDEVDIIIHSDLVEPTIVDVNVAIYDSESGDIVDSTRENLGSVPRYKRGEYDEKISFVIPDLPAGNYERVTGLTSGNFDTKPAFVTIPFSIAECP